MPAPIPLEPPVTSATLPLNDFACVTAIDILLVLPFCVLDSSVQNATQKVSCQGRSKTRPRGGARIAHFLGRRKLIVAFSAATHSFKTQARETRRTSEIASQNAGFTRPSGDVPFQEGTPTGRRYSGTRSGSAQRRSAAPAIRA